MGGRSTRMGESKADLAWHGSTLLYRTAAMLGRSVDGPVVVVAAPGQELPALPAGVAVVEDPVAGLGPMQGLAAGLAAVAGRADAAFVCSTDLPFLHPAFVRRVLRALTGEADVALPVARGYRQPLAAAYRTTLAPVVADLLAGGLRRPGLILEHCAVIRLDDAALLDDPELAAGDPALDSVVNVNTPEEYRAARDQKPPEIVVTRDGRRHAVRAATLGAAAAAIGVAPPATAELNDVWIDWDAQLPLAARDAVTFARSEGTA